MSNYETSGNPLEEITVKFMDDSYWIIRHKGIGDTICGEFAHKVMHSYNRFVLRGNLDSFYNKVEFVVRWSEDIANNPNGINS